MESLEFLPAIQRLQLIATMIEGTDIDGVVAHLAHAEAVAMLFPPDVAQSATDRLRSINKFALEAQRFRNVCREYRTELEAAAALRRRALTEGESHAREG